VGPARRRRTRVNPGANPTIVIYNASAVKMYNARAVKIYNAASRPVRFENKYIFFY
jgi:hypothetical protein